MRDSPLNSAHLGPLGTVALASLAPHLGLILFTVLTAGIALYLIYTMLRPDRF